MSRTAPQARTSEIRTIRMRLRLSQPIFASSLGVSPETYRAWDSGRRTVPGTWLEKARALAVINDPETAHDQGITRAGNRHVRRCKLL